MILLLVIGMIVAWVLKSTWIAIAVIAFCLGLAEAQLTHIYSQLREEEDGE